MLDTYYQNLLEYADRRLEKLGDRDKLLVAGDLYLEIAKIISERANMSLDEWRIKYDPSYSDYIPGLFDDLVINKTSSSDFSSLLVDSKEPEEDLLVEDAIETPKVKSRKIKQVSLSEIIAQSHTEDIEGWSEILKSVLDGKSLTLTKLISLVELTPGATIYTLLLKGFKLEQTGDFYDNSQIIVN